MSFIKVIATPKPDPSETVPRATALFRPRLTAACPGSGGWRSQLAGRPEVGP